MTGFDIYSILMCLTGAFFFLAGSVGLLRFPDVTSRLHALTKADNLGLGLIVLGLLPQLSSVLQALQMLLIWGLVLISGASCSYLIASTVDQRTSRFTKQKSRRAAK